MKPERAQGSRLATGSTCRHMYVHSYMQEHKKKGTQHKCTQPQIHVRDEDSHAF